MQIFYTPDISVNPELPEEESGHCVRVLRLSEGAEILLTDGKGKFYKATITVAHPKHCQIEVTDSWTAGKPWPFYVTEIGIDEITCLNCRFSERKEVKPARLKKILVSAMKQSQKSVLPKLNGMTDFRHFVEKPFEGRKFIAHCEEEEKPLIKDIYKSGENALVLIGPEGDFSPEEIALAKANGFEAISLGNSRLRTETAALVACHTLHVLN